jgi:large subunit ribosomal protein L9
MRIILREDVASLGKSGDLVTVKDGYGRNYLLPQGLGMLATEHNVKQIEHQKKVIAARTAKLTKDAQGVADKLGSLTLKIGRQAGEGGKLFGSVSTRDIEEAAAALGVTIDRRKVVIADPIKVLGEYSVEVKMGQGVLAKLKVVVEESKAN